MSSYPSFTSLSEVATHLNATPDLIATAIIWFTGFPFQVIAFKPTLITRTHT
jgi:hypothetical protein